MKCFTVVLITTTLIILLLASSSDASAIYNVLGYVLSSFSRRRQQARTPCTRTCKDIIAQTEDSTECLNEVRAVRRQRCSFDHRSCQKSCMDMNQDDYCSPGCLQSIGNDFSHFESYEGCQYSLKNTESCQNHRESCSKRCPAKVIEEVTLECPSKCLSFADLGSKDCWEATKTSSVCSQYKSCYQRCMTNETCPDECNISMMLDQDSCITFIENFHACQIHKDCYGKCSNKDDGGRIISETTGEELKNEDATETVKKAEEEESESEATEESDSDGIVEEVKEEGNSTSEIKEEYETTEEENGEEDKEAEKREGTGSDNRGLLSRLAGGLTILGQNNNWSYSRCLSSMYSVSVVSGDMKVQCGRYFPLMNGFAVSYP